VTESSKAPKPFDSDSLGVQREQHANDSHGRTTIATTVRRRQRKHKDRLIHNIHKNSNSTGAKVLYPSKF
jgi:hypothetical protein